MRTSITHEGTTIDIEHDDDVWRVRIGEDEAAATYLDYALAQLPGIDSETAHRIAARILEEIPPEAGPELAGG